MDLKSAFDSVDRESLWLMLQRLGLPMKIVNLLKALYTDTCNCVLADGTTSDWFQVNCGVRQGCRIAADLFAAPMDWLMERTVHRGCSGCTLGREVFTDLDFADDTALLAEMLEVLLLAPEVMNEEATPLGLEINWLKTKIQEIGEPPHTETSVAICNAQVKLVESFVYLGSAQHRNGSSDTEIRRRIAIAPDCMTQINRHIWKSSISVSTKVRLYKVYILPVLLYCCDTWTVTKQLSDRIDAFDMWCLRKILRIPYTRHVTNVEVRRVTGCPAASRLVRMRRLQLFGHLADEEDHHRVLVAAMSNPPKDGEDQEDVPKKLG